ncbi:glyoxalase [Chania multitudinisentens RB-25]|uniref:Glyoxalase n=1 Tax=Chania multitudinisentens RB-25 TaxID=1441930 RepID=W0L8W5_9GAMM|nr:VOC family protein [Chania multitudinisentens]AHG18712.1 glyoxalase [Chania multitudinisentens RB-25]
MIDHTGINVSQFAQSQQFYTAVLASLGYVLRLQLGTTAAGYGEATLRPGDDPGGTFWISVGEPSTPRIHIAFRATSKAQVNAFYEVALAAGAKDNGAPGFRHRYHKNYYAAFVYDPDGYNIEAVFHGAEESA